MAWTPIVVTRWTPFTTTPQIGTDTFPEDIDVRNDEMTSRMAEIDDIGQEIDAAAQSADANAAIATTKAAEASASALIALSSVNYKGDWVANYGGVGYAQNDSISYTDGYNYISKITNNLVEPTTLTNTTEWNFVEAVNPNNYYLKTEVDTKSKLWQNKTVTKNLTANEDYTLTASENEYGRIIITDSTPFLTVARNIIVDTSERAFLFQNDTLQTLTVKTSAGAGVLVSAGAKVDVVCDGTNVVKASEADINALTAKTTPVDADEDVTADSEDGFTPKKVTWANRKATLKTYFDTLYAKIATPIKTGVTTIVVDGNSLEMSLYVTPTAGLDYYFSKTAITTTVQADTIGGFHYSLVPQAEAATGNKTEADMVKLRGINEYSIWTLWDRPICFDPRGKAKVGSRWYDIYLMDRDYGIRGYSAPTVHTGANIAAGVADAIYFRQIPKIPLAYGGDGTVTYGKYSWFQACEVATATGNQNISYSEFPTIAYGVLEGVDSSAYGDNGTIFHIPQLMSKYGIEMATGTEQVWGADVGGNRDEGSITWAWRNQADSRGQIYALHDNHITAVILGGGRSLGVYAGSRSSFWSYFVWGSSWLFGSRFACDSLEHA